MSVELEPSELGFRRPFQQEVAQVLRLRNNNSDPVAFKVKTTAPKQYCVRPNSGRIDAGDAVEVQVLLQAMKEDPPPDAKCRDKFLVQSVAVSADREFTNVASIWSHMEETNKSAIQERKIRVLFLPAQDAATSTPAKANGASSHLASSPSPEAVTPQQRGIGASPSGPVSRPDSRPSNAPNLGEALESAHNPASSTASNVQSTISNAASSVAASIPTSSEDLKAQLAQAKATIADLQSQISNQSGLRQRKTNTAGKEDSKAGDALATVQQQAPGGVAVPVVAILCLLSFILAYLFF